MKRALVDRPDKGFQFAVTSMVKTVTSGSNASGILMMSNRVKHTNAFSTVNTLDGSLSTYVANVQADTYVYLLYVFWSLKFKNSHVSVSL